MLNAHGTIYINLLRIERFVFNVGDVIPPVIIGAYPRSLGERNVAKHARQNHHHH